MLLTNIYSFLYLVALFKFIILEKDKQPHKHLPQHAATSSIWILNCHLLIQ